jgi:cytidylate kinase
MTNVESLERYFAAHASLRERETGREPPRPFLTISRETGAGGFQVGRRLIDLLNQGNRTTPPWMLFDRDLIKAVIETHNLPADASRYLTEHSVSALSEFVRDMLGITPGTDTVLRKTKQTMAALAKMGHCVLIGRGANFATARLGAGFHIRLVADHPTRVRRIRDEHGLDERGAAGLVKELDAGRRDFVRNAYARDITDPLAYDCLINTTGVSFDSAAVMIAAHVKAMQAAGQR